MPELNAKIKIIAIIIIFLIIISGIPFKLVKNFISPKNETNNTIIVYQNFTEYITVTPTIDGKIYFAGEYQNGTRLLNHPFSIYRGKDGNFKVNNINSNSTLKMSVNVYDYVILDNFHWWNTEYTNSPSEEGWSIQYPVYNNDKFLVIFVSLFTDDIISEKVNKIWLPNENSFAIQINENMYYPISYPKMIRIKEFETRTNINDAGYIEAFGQYRQYIGKFSINKDSSDSENGTFIKNGMAGDVSITDYYVPMGKSNAEDGYIIFEIPENTKPEDILVRMNFHNFGYSSWKLINPYILN